MDEAPALLHDPLIRRWAGGEMQVVRGFAGLVRLQALAVVMLVGQASAQVAPASPQLQAQAAQSSAQEAAWATAVREHIVKHRRYPRDALAAGQQGTVVVRVTLGRDGSVISTATQRSSGFALLDEEASNMVWRSHPVPPPPPGVGDRYVVLEIPVTFRRDEKTR
jgi:TonB family protein